MLNKAEMILKDFVDKREIAGAALLIRKKGELITEFAYGYTDLEEKTPVDRNTMFRLASMTKPITAIAVMQLVESGQIHLYDEIKKYIPEFTAMKVCKNKLGEEVYQPDPTSPSGKRVGREKLEEMIYVPEKRPVTIFDILNHSSGLGMGPVGNTMAEDMMRPQDTLQERAVKYAQLPLDFQPGEGCGYSALVGFEVLAAIVERVSGTSFDEYLKERIFVPLGINDIIFEPNEEQKNRMSRLYEYTGTDLVDVTEQNVFWKLLDPDFSSYHSGAAGLIGTVEEYEKIAHMFLNKGVLEGNRILRQESVEQMAGYGISHQSIALPGYFWGLGVSVADQKCLRSPGSFGWSGAFGTHFYVDPMQEMDLVLGVNRSNIGGADSYVSHAVEAAVSEM